MTAEAEQKASGEDKAQASTSSSTSMATTATAPNQVALLDEEGELSDAFLRALSHVFVRFSAQARSAIVLRIRSSGDGGDDVAYRHDDVASTTKTIAKCVLTSDELDSFARAVNDGTVMSDAEKEEVREYFDVDEHGSLTFTGFCEMYHLQSGSSDDETWKDMRALGFDDRLERIKAGEPKRS